MCVCTILVSLIPIVLGNIFYLFYFIRVKGFPEESVPITPSSKVFKSNFNLNLNFFLNLLFDLFNVFILWETRNWKPQVDHVIHLSCRGRGPLPYPAGAEDPSLIMQGPKTPPLYCRGQDNPARDQDSSPPLLYPAGAQDPSLILRVPKIPPPSLILRGPRTPPPPLSCGAQDPSPAPLSCRGPGPLPPSISCEGPGPLSYPAGAQDPSPLPIYALRVTVNCYYYLKRFYFIFNIPGVDSAGSFSQYSSSLYCYKPSTLQYTVQSSGIYNSLPQNFGNIERIF